MTAQRQDQSQVSRRRWVQQYIRRGRNGQRTGDVVNARRQLVPHQGRDPKTSICGQCGPGTRCNNDSGFHLTNSTSYNVIIIIHITGGNSVYLPIHLVDLHDTSRDTEQVNGGEDTRHRPFTCPAHPSVLRSGGGGHASLVVKGQAPWGSVRLEQDHPTGTNHGSPQRGCIHMAAHCPTCSSLCTTRQGCSTRISWSVISMKAFTPTSTRAWRPSPTAPPWTSSWRGQSSARHTCVHQPPRQVTSQWWCAQQASK